MEGSPGRQPLRLARYLEESGTYATWLARGLGVARSTLHAWTHGDTPMPAEKRAQVLELLRERAGLPLSDDLFEREEDDVQVG